MRSSPIPSSDFIQQGKPVFSGADALLKFTNWLTQNLAGDRLVVLCDRNTAEHCLPDFMNCIPDNIIVSEIIIEPGENSKSWEACRFIWQKLTELNVERNDILVNLGGGVVSDVGGFVAATYLRGIAFVNVPTTLMALADAALGGKTGIDLDHFKNRVGTIVFPECTVCWPGFLQTLPDREWRSGTAEVYKHALIADPELWRLLREHGCEAADFSSLLHPVQRVKLEVVHADPFEKGVRKILNFGHTIGHAIESRSLLTDAVPLNHGQAIAMGMVLETNLSLRMKKIREGEANEIITVLQSRFGKVSLHEMSVSALLKWMRFDKKNVQGKIKMSLLTSIGSCEWNLEVKEELIAQVLKEYGAIDE